MCATAFTIEIGRMTSTHARCTVKCQETIHMQAEQVMEATADALCDQRAMCALFQSGSFDNKADASA